MSNTLENIVDLENYPISDSRFREMCNETLESNGSLVLPGFLIPAAVQSVAKEGQENQHLAYFCEQKHNILLTPPDAKFDAEHPRNLQVVSSKGCITDDQIPDDSALRRLYDSPAFREFLCAVLHEQTLYEYADSMSSINLHYASDGQELGWHFDNSSFAITLMIQEPNGGGEFEYVQGLRDSVTLDVDFSAVKKTMNGNIKPSTLSMTAGTLVLFRGHTAMHRVTPVIGEKERMLVVLAYNSEPGIELSESARMTFYGRLG